MTELPECFCLDLSDTLSRDIKLPSDLFQCAGTSVIHSKPEAEHLLLSLGQCIKNLVKLLLQKSLRGSLRRNRYIIVLDKISQVAVLLLSDRSLKGNRLL